MKKILIILPYFPYPLNSGGNIANYEMINFLRFKHSITLLALNSTEENMRNLRMKWDNVEIITYISESFTQLLIKRISKVLLHIYLFSISLILEKKNYAHTYLTTTLNPYINPNLVKQLSRLQIENSYDYIQVEFFELLPLIQYLNNKSTSVFIHHELRFVRYQRMIEMNRFNKLMMLLIKGQEIEFLKQYNKVVTVSDFDKRQLEFDLNPNQLYSSTLTISIPQKKIDNEYEFNNTITFLGGSEHFPNKDAIYWFLESCWGKLLQNSNLQLHIIGNWSKSDSELLNKKYRNVKFLGFVENLEVALSNSIMIVPIRIGSGMRMKIIEAANYGVPFITTTIGVEGLDFCNHVDCIIADGADAFSDAIIQLSKDSNLQKSLVSNAFKTIDLKYNSARLFEKRNSIYS